MPDLVARVYNEAGVWGDVLVQLLPSHFPTSIKLSLRRADQLTFRHFAEITFIGDDVFFRVLGGTQHGPEQYQATLATKDEREDGK